MAKDKIESGEHAILILAIRGEIESVVAPLKAEMHSGFDALREEIRDNADTFNRRFSQGDTEIALLKRASLEQGQRCAQHHAEPGTGRTGKKLNPYFAMFISGALSAIGTVAGLWFLTSLGHAAQQNTPTQGHPP